MHRGVRGALRKRRLRDGVALDEVAQRLQVDADARHRRGRRWAPSAVLVATVRVPPWLGRRRRTTLHPQRAAANSESREPSH